MITPWNFPLAMGTRKIDRHRCRCTMVVKPAALTPLSTLALGDIMASVPFDGAQHHHDLAHRGRDGLLIRDARLRKLTFTGSTSVGQRLVEQSAQGLLRVSMELGGNAPFLVFADADIDAAVDGAMLAKMRNLGEARISRPIGSSFTSQWSTSSPVSSPRNGRPLRRPAD